MHRTDVKVAIQVCQTFVIEILKYEYAVLPTFNITEATSKALYHIVTLLFTQGVNVTYHTFILQF